MTFDLLMYILARIQNIFSLKRDTKTMQIIIEWFLENFRFIIYYSLVIQDGHHYINILFEHRTLWENEKVFFFL